MRSTLLLAAAILLAPPAWAELPSFAPEETQHFAAGPATAHYLTPLERLERAAPGKNLDRISRLGNSLQMLVLEHTLNPGRAIDLDRFELDGGHPYTTTWFQKDGLPVVDITVVGDVQKAMGELEAAGAEVLAHAEGSGYWLIGAAVPVAKLEDCLGASGVRAIQSSGAMTGRTFDENGTKRPEADPHDSLPAAPRAERVQGAATNQAETALDVDDALRYFPTATGGGIDIGTLSDSANRISGIPNDGGLVGYAESQASGDLPVNARINTVADNAAAGSLTDEGRGMMEHIYDLVPACATYGFATAFFGGEAGFGANITALRNAGMEVINDDVVYFGEPYYQDGPVAQAVNAAVNAGRLYFALNHNYANNSYEGVWSDPDGDSWHEFNGANDELWRFTLNNGSRLRAGLQWSQPWGSATTDLQFQLWNNNNPVAMIQADGTNNIGGNPYDFIDYTNNTGGTQTLNFAVRRLSGASAAGLTLKFVCFNGTTVTPQEYPANRAGTLTPHAGTPLSIAIGAARYDNPQLAEAFSGRGPHRRFFNTNGTATGPITYTKPDFMSVDGCDTTFFGSQADWDATGFPNFFGTSAATPNAAAVAVMMLDAAGGPNTLNQADVRNIMRLTAVEAGAAGHDTTYGFGRIMALGAVAAARGPATSDITYLYPNQFGDASRTSTFSSNTDTDSVRWALDLSGSVTVSVTDPGTADPMFVLFNQTTGALVGADYNSGVGDDPMMTYTGTTWSRYQADLYSEAPFVTANQEYTISINGPSISTLAFPALDEFGNGITLGGNINAAGDMDYYTLTAPATATGSVTIVLDPADTFDGMIFLFDSAGNELARRDSFFAGGTETLIYNSVTANQALVIGTAGYQHNSSGTYSLAVNFSNVPGQPTTLTLPDFVQYVVRPNPVTGFYSRLFRNIGEGEYDHGLFVPDGSSAMTHSALTSNGTFISGGIYNQAGTRQAWDGENGDDTGFTVEAATPSFQQYRLTTYGASTGTRGSGILFSSSATEAPPPGPDGQLNFMASNGLWSANNQLVDIFGDVDYYRLVTPYNAGNQMTVTIDGDGSFQGQVTVYNASGTAIGVAAANVDGGSAQTVVPVQPLSLYYIAAHGNANFNVNRTQANQVGNFSLNASMLLIFPDSSDSDGDGFRDDYEDAYGSIADDADDYPNLGDANGDGITNMFDALHLMRILPVTPYDPKLDVNLSGSVNAADARAIFNWSTKRAGYEVLPLVP